MGKKKEVTGVEKAITSAGSQANLAAALGVKQQAVSAWLKKGFVPPKRAAEIEHQFGVPRATLVSQKLRDAVDAGSGL